MNKEPSKSMATTVDNTDITNRLAAARQGSVFYREAIKYTVSALIIGVGVVALVVLKSFAKPPANRESTSLVPQVDVRQVTPYVGHLDMEVSGTVVPFREIRVAAEVAGRVTNKTAVCEAGSFVSKGDLLLEIDPEEYRLDISAREADVEQAKRRIEENKQVISGEKKNIRLAESDLGLQTDQYDRNRRLQNVLSKTEVDSSRRGVIAAESQLTLRRNNLASLEASSARLEAALQVAERQLEKALLNLRRASVVAPADGVIVNEMVQVGDYVARGTQLVTFEDTRQAEIVCNLTTAELNQIRKHAAASNEGGLDQSVVGDRSVYKLPSTPVTIYDPSVPGVYWHGVLDRFDGIGVDSVTKTIPCRITVLQPVTQGERSTVALVRGMFVKCLLEFHISSGSDKQTYLAVPELAVHPNGYVWLVKNDQLQRRPVNVVDYVAAAPASREAVASRLAVIERNDEGPEPNDWIVVSPLSQPSDGAKVEVSSRSAEGTPTIDQEATDQL